MGSVSSAAWEGLTLTLSWPNILYPVIGTVVAMVAAVLPGISGVTLMVLVIPLTLFWNPLEIMLLFGALVGGATFMGSVTGILINVPGRASNAATMFDGYPLSQQGEAKTAIACSATASALGSTFGVLVLIMLIPFMIPLVLEFGPLELLAAIIWGLSTIAFVVRGSWLKGLVIAGVGLALSFVGTDPQTAEPRFTLGSLYLMDGLPPILVFLGIFAVAEMIQLLRSKAPTISGKDSSRVLSGSAADGIGAVFRNFPLFLRCSAIGTIVGMIPGVGATVASFVAYGHAAQAKDGRFGEGDIRGVIAPEAANDAKDGGSLVPTLAFGIPGGLATAMLLTAFTLHGINPGRDLLTGQLGLVFVLIWSLFFSNWLTSLLGLAGVNWFARVTTISTRFIVPAVLVTIVLSTYAYRSSVSDSLLVMIFGAVGYYLKKYNWPRPPFVIALVLGPYFENNLHIVLQLQRLDRLVLTEHPIALLLGVLTVLGLLIPWWRGRDTKKAAPSDDLQSIFSGALLLVLIIAMLWLTQELSAIAAVTPRLVLLFTTCLLLLYLCSGLVGQLKAPQPWARSPEAGEAGALATVSLIFVLVWATGPVAGVALFLFLFCMHRLRLSAVPLVLWILAGTSITWILVHQILGRAFDGGWLGSLL